MLGFLFLLKRKLYISDIFLLMNLVATFIPLVSTTIVLHLCSRKDEQEPKWMKAVLFKRLLRLGPGTSPTWNGGHKEEIEENNDEEKMKNKQTEEAENKPAEQKSFEEEHHQEINMWIQCAKMTERLFFWLWIFDLLCTYLILIIMSVRSARIWETK